MNRWQRATSWRVGALAAFLLVLTPLSLAYAADPGAHAQVVKMRVEVTDAGFGPGGDFAIEVEQGHQVELTFAWAHVGYPQERHIMILDMGDQKLEWDEINFEKREATQSFVADKPGSFNFRCDLDCDIHDYLQKGTLKISRGGAGGGSIAYTPTALSLSSSSLVTAGDPVILTAALRDAQGKPVAKAEIRFLQDASFAGTKAQMEIGVAKTDANGVAFLEFQPVMADRQQTITATFAGKGLFAESQQAIQITEAGVPPSAYEMASIGLEPLRRWAPFGLAGIILGVWATFGFVMFRAFGMAWARPRS